MLTVCDIYQVWYSTFVNWYRNNCDWFTDIVEITLTTQLSSVFLLKTLKLFSAAVHEVLTNPSVPLTAVTTPVSVRTMKQRKWRTISNSPFSQVVYNLTYEQRNTIYNYMPVKWLMAPNGFTLVLFVSPSMPGKSLLVLYRPVCGKVQALWWTGWLSGWERWDFLLYVNHKIM